MWLFDSPKNYLEMVEKISKSVFIVTLFSLFMMASANNDFASFLRSLSFGVEYEFSGIKFYLAFFYIPMLISISEHAFKLHDKISNISGIRKRFDRNVIINEFLIKLKIKKKLSEIDAKAVQKIMSNAFYKYVSSTTPIIDGHYIYLALGCWCWYWIILDTLFVAVVTGTLFLVYNWTCSNLFVFLAIIVFVLLLLALLMMQIKVYAKDEVREILRDEVRRKDIEKGIKDAL